MKSIEINTPKGYPITLQLFGDENNSDKVVIISSATGVKQYYYAKFAAFLAEHNLSVVTFDYGGIGFSKKTPLNHFDTDAFAWGSNDLNSVIEYVAAHFPDKKIILIGHSIGGQIVGLAKEARQASQILLVAAQTGYWRHWQGIGKIRMWTNWYVIFPLMTSIFKYLPASKFSNMEDLPRGVARQWRYWCTCKDYLFDSIEPQSLYYHTLTCKIISYSCNDDQYAPKIAVDWMAEKYSSAQMKRVHWFPADVQAKKIGHFGFFQAKHRDTIWQNFLQTIQEK